MYAGRLRWTTPLRAILAFVFRTIAESAAWLAEWARTAPDLPPYPSETLDAYLVRQGITHFSARECRTLRRIGVIAPEPRRAWWPRIVPAGRFAEDLRAAMGHPLWVGNGYRPRALNRRVGGASRSAHVGFWALDLDLPPEHDDAENRRRFYRAAVGLWLDGDRLGLGLYSSGSRVHVDGRRRRYWRKKIVRPILESMR